jgi:hypothetical protein
MMPPGRQPCHTPSRLAPILQIGPVPLPVEAITP